MSIDPRSDRDDGARDSASTAVPVPEGAQIIAVHVAYESRAAQRGRRPEQPSYFLKPAGSLAGSGGVVERPEGTELLAFEGEIALIIGATAHRVGLAEAWAHVGAVTAANDLGLYDYRAADKGSNLRSKGRAGYTPLGPELIDARAVDPAALRVRTWVNGELRQEDTTADEHMIFPLARFVADLSQHLVLRPGDVILTGTPAGSSVIAPGDVVEVEVDAPDAAGHPTSGRLSTRVVAGPGGFDAALGSLPTTDEKQREEAWGSREAAGLVPDDAVPAESATAESAPAATAPAAPASARHPTTPAPLDPELRALLESTPTAGLSAQLRARGIHGIVIEGVHPLTPGTRMVGVARTLRFLPLREDLFAEHGGGYNAQKRAFDAVGEGEVLVIEARGETGSGTLGDVLALRARHLGAAGVVTDGGVRDSAAVAGIGLPVFAGTRHPAVLGERHVPWEADTAVACGNAAVLPGDVLVGDDDGVIVIPRALAREVAEAAREKEIQDEWVAERVAQGHPVDGLFPPVGTWKEAYRTWRSEQG
ncbi:fumarylacetoacetate hydrolase family protein [Rothia kristinae]|uniref:Fumarylacetoacetate hydrolase family protein n=2 Tax=Rothia kristinae TaxID=37923 RepID=A0A7T3CK96_9MICC|nr:fumarylacetoacetate hydrolase family protein [Rothia kristinae]QPT54453.1 fumarylacetoacetate hydrolase family protein [Rothia kristinae]SQC30497.1 Homoprotocatechuate catabolism bifunctional isomerase/decarboxylase [Rothia kristinae]SQC36792.1 Homoprotocatechuate catabolism bifunctional isomerase/decarboxylase [Rothia kristinae]